MMEEISAKDGTVEEIALASASDSDEENFEVCFKVEDMEFFTFKLGFMQQSSKFRELVSATADEQIRIQLPPYAKAKAFRIILDYVNFGEMFWENGDAKKEGQDVYLMQNVLWLADYFRIEKLMTICIQKYI